MNMKLNVFIQEGGVRDTITLSTKANLDLHHKPRVLINGLDIIKQSTPKSARRHSERFVESCSAMKR